PGPRPGRGPGLRRPRRRAAPAVGGPVQGAADVDPGGTAGPGRPRRPQPAGLPAAARARHGLLAVGGTGRRPGAAAGAGTGGGRSVRPVRQRGRLRAGRPRPGPGSGRGRAPAAAAAVQLGRQAGPGARLSLSGRAGTATISRLFSSTFDRPGYVATRWRPGSPDEPRGAPQRPNTPRRLCGFRDYEAIMSIDNQKIIEEHARGANDTGSPEVQVALLTARIVHLTEHFKTHKKDHHS